MSTRDRKTGSVIGGLLILLLLALGGFRLISQIIGGMPFDVISLFFIVFVLVGLMVVFTYGYMSSPSLAELDESMDDPTTGPIYYEETTPKKAVSKTPVLSCPDCGHKNPLDADFCIRCGRDLDITDDVARY